MHTAHRLRFQRDGDPRHLVALTDFIREHPVTSHEHSDLADSCRGRAWLGQVVAPTEACINALAQFPAGARGAGRMSLSSLEVPSALAVLRRECPGIEVEIAGPPPPDMVRPPRPGRPLWRYEGTAAHPAVEPASARAASLLAETATPTWAHPVAASDQALPLGQLPVEELRSLLVHPPARPERLADLPDGFWERCAQVFACLGILHCQELSSGTPGDTIPHRRVLAEIAYGIEDWTTEAALFALTVAAWCDPVCRAEVPELVGRRFLQAAEAAQQRPVTILDSLAELVPIVPGMPAEVVSLARELRSPPPNELPADPGA